MTKYFKMPEEVKEDIIICKVIRYKFYCPNCGRRVKATRHGPKQYRFRSCPCGFESEMVSV